MMESGIASVSFRSKSVEEIIAASAAAGLDGIEWGSDVHVPAGNITLAREVRRKTEAAGLKVLSYGSYYRLGAQAAEDEFSRVLASAAELGVQNVRVWGGSKGSAELSPDEWSVLRKRLRKMELSFRSNAITIQLRTTGRAQSTTWKM